MKGSTGGNDCTYISHKGGSAWGCYTTCGISKLVNIQHGERRKNAR